MAKLLSIDEMLKAAEEASAHVRRTFKISSERASKDLVHPELWVSTGSLALDRAITGLVPGGIPIGPKRGCVVHIFGDPSLGKSLLLDHIFLSCQKLGGWCLVSETEGSRSPHFAQAIGLDLRRVEIQRPDTIEQLVDGGIGWITDFRKKFPHIPIVWGWDSLELTEAEKTLGVAMSGKGGGAHHFGGGRGEAIGSGCRKIAKLCAKTQTDFIILNQVRENVGVMFGSPTKPPGGKAARFFASVEIQLVSSEKGRVTERGRAVGRWVRAKVVKNKVAPPFAECHFLMRFDSGVVAWSGIPEMLEAEGVVRFEREKKVDSKTGREKKGNVTGETFQVVATKERFPLRDFSKWCVTSKVLTTIPKPEDGPAEGEGGTENAE